MKTSLLLGIALALSCGSKVWAQPKPLSVAAQQATKTVFATGFGEPSGVACDRNGHVFVCDVARGEVVMLSLKGARFRTLVKGLQQPTGIVSPGFGSDTFSVSERGANRVIAIDSQGRVLPLGEPIDQPIGVGGNGVDNLLAISAQFEPLACRTMFPNGSFLGDGARLPHVWAPLFSLSQQQAHPQLTNLIRSGQDVFLSEPTAGTLWKFSAATGLHRFAQGLGAPSGMALSKNGALYVCDQSAGGRLLRLDDQGQATVVATELGRPCALLWTSAQTALVANRDGNIWKLAF